MPGTHSRHAALATLVGGAAGALTAAPALACHGLLHRQPRGAAPRQPSGPRAEAAFGSIPLRDTGVVLGRDTAPVTVIRHGSLTCPHCAAFHAATAAALKRAHIPAGPGRSIHRRFPLDPAAMAGAMLLPCGNASRDGFFALLDLLHDALPDRGGAADPIAALRGIAVRTGVNGAEFDACLSDRALADRILEQRTKDAETCGVQATPTLLINGARYSGSLTHAQIETVIRNVG